MKNSIEKYIELLIENNIEEAKIVKKRIIPKKLYKYVSLNNDSSMNDSKINGLKDSELWMSRAKYLNDPFEFKGVFLDIKKLKQSNCSDKTIANYKYILESNKNNYLLTSLTNTVTNNMPMWAHYSNNHKGICIEFDIIDSSKIYPIIYESKREGIGYMIDKFLRCAHSFFEGNIDDTDSDISYYAYLFMLMGLQKHLTWSYEKEYRVILPNLDDGKNGQKVLLKNLGLEINSIYIGINCDKENEDIIRETLKESNIKVNKMKLEEQSEDFALIYE